MKKRLLLAILPIAAIILELLPYGAVCRFANGPDEIVRKTYSYFNPTPYAYANFGPLITAVLTCVMLIEVIIYAFTEKAKTPLIITVALAVFASLSPLLISSYSVLGAAISLLLIAQAVFICVFTLKNQKQ